MDIIFISALVTLLLIVFFVFIYNLLIVNNKGNRKKTNIVSSDKDVEKNLTKLQSDSLSTKEISKTFVELLEKNYVCIYRKENSGDKYNDKKQKKRFRGNVTTERIKSVISMEIY